MSNHLTPPVNAKDHIQGNEDAVIELVEYGDYQCPHCGRAYPILKNIQRRLGKDVKFVFRNFPLAESHPNAVHAAIAAEAAALQNEFWEMHDTLFENQRRLSDNALLSYAEQLGLSIEQFRKDFEDEKQSAKVENDLESGIRSGVNGTPSFFINGAKYNGNWEEEEFFEYLQAYLA
ncbi:MAG: oxidoreductase [Ferruginibacter sp.]|nr:oxidoreductase [Ferruginibacter sp.]